MNDERTQVDVYGRTFQQVSLDKRIYLAPVASDESEEHRLEVQHEIICQIFEDKLISPGIPLDYPERVLECGYGGGHWCVQFAEEYEESTVLALDIYPFQLPHQPENLELETWNLNVPFRDPQTFQARAYDLIHSQFVSPGIHTNRWASYIQDMRLLLRPGGWVQLVEYYPLVQSDKGLLTDDSAVRKWWEEYDLSMRDLQRDPRIGRRMKDLLIRNGYQDVVVEIQRLPIGDWHPDPIKASIGEKCISMVGDLLESLSLWPFTDNRKWTIAKFNEHMAEIRTELKDGDLRLYIDVHIARGRRSP